jgi:glycosyltransferase involved in cell wall biosynthesis
MKTKSILLIGNYPPPYGGVPRHLEYLGEHLTENGWSVHVLSSGHSGILHNGELHVYKFGLLKKLFCFGRFLFGRHRYSFHLSGLFFRFFRDWLRYAVYFTIGCRIIRKHRIALISTYNLFSFAPVGAMLSEHFSIPLVVTNFGELHSLRRFFMKNPDLLKYICARATRLLAMSRHCAQSYQMFGLSPQVEVIPYGVDVERFSPDINPEKLLMRLNIQKEDQLVLFMGRITKEMGADIFSEAVPEILGRKKNIRCLFAGQEGDSLTAVRQMASRFPGKVFFAVNIPFNDLHLYYAAASILVAPTEGERACGSLVAIEAMACGKPVIASRVGGMPEIVVDGETGKLIPPRDTRALAAAVLEMLSEPEMMKKMGLKGRERVERFFDEENTDRKLAALFSSLMEV